MLTLHLNLGVHRLLVGTLPLEISARQEKSWAFVILGACTCIWHTWWWWWWPSAPPPPYPPPPPPWESGSSSLDRCCPARSIRSKAKESSLISSQLGIRAWDGCLHIRVVLLIPHKKISLCWEYSTKNFVSASFTPPPPPPPPPQSGIETECHLIASTTSSSSLTSIAWPLQKVKEKESGLDLLGSACLEIELCSNKLNIWAALSHGCDHLRDYKAASIFDIATSGSRECTKAALVFVTISSSICTECDTMGQAWFVATEQGWVGRMPVFLYDNIPWNLPEVVLHTHCSLGPPGHPVITFQLLKRCQIAGEYILKDPYINPLVMLRFLKNRARTYMSTY